MRAMTDEEWRAFVRTGTRTGKLAIVLPSGRPSVTPVWFVLDDDGVLRFNTHSGSPKATAMRREPRVALLVDVEAPPYAFVRIDGRAELSDDPAEVRRVARAAGGRYMGEARADEYGARNGVDGELVVALRPERVVAFDGVAD